MNPNGETADLIHLPQGGLPDDDLAAIAAAVKNAVETHIVRSRTSKGTCEKLTVVDIYGQAMSLEQALALTEDAIGRSKALGAGHDQLAGELNLSAFAWLLRFYLTAPALRPAPTEIPVKRSQTLREESFAPGLGTS